MRQDNTNQSRKRTIKNFSYNIVKDPELPRAERRNKIEIQPVYSIILCKPHELNGRYLRFKLHIIKLHLQFSKYGPLPIFWIT